MRNIKVPAVADVKHRVFQVAAVVLSFGATVAIATTGAAYHNSNPIIVLSNYIAGPQPGIDLWIFINTSKGEIT